MNRDKRERFYRQVEKKRELKIRDVLNRLADNIKGLTSALEKAINGVAEFKSGGMVPDNINPLCIVITQNPDDIKDVEYIESEVIPSKEYTLTDYNKREIKSQSVFYHNLKTEME